MATILTALNSQDTDKRLPPPHCCRRRLTHPFAVQQQVDFEDHAVVDCDLLVPVKDLKDPAEDGAIVNPRRAEAAFLWWGDKKRRHWDD